MSSLTEQVVRCSSLVLGVKDEASAFLTAASILMLARCLTTHHSQNSGSSLFFIPDGKLSLLSPRRLAPTNYRPKLSHISTLKPVTTKGNDIVMMSF